MLTPFILLIADVFCGETQTRESFVWAGKYLFLVARLLYRISEAAFSFCWG